MKINYKMGDGWIPVNPEEIWRRMTPFSKTRELGHHTIKQILRVMKLTILLILIALLQVTAATKAQITINAKQEPLRKVLEKISRQSGYDFIYAVEDFKKANPVDIQLNNASLEKALQIAFQGQPLIYEVNDKTVMVKRKEEKQTSIIEKIKGYFATVNVRGRVVDENYQPLQGTSVTIKNGKGAVTTDVNGLFYIKNVDENATLVFTFIGFSKKEILINGKEDLGDVLMNMSTSKLDEVQVMFSGVTSRRTSTSDITTLKAEDIAKQPIDNPLYALQGRVPGLIVTPSSGLPGAPVKLQIRGQNSLTGTFTQPLIVIDNVPYNNDVSSGSPFFFTSTISALRFINPSDIESIDVLKDADATAVYGSRGANGVILITTKKGRSGETKIDVNTSLGFNERAGKKLDLLNTQQYLQMRKEAFINDGLGMPTTPSSDNYDLTLWDPNRYTNWQDELADGRGAFNSIQASISGGSVNIRYLISGTYSGQSSLFPGHGKDQSGTGHFSLSGNSPNGKFNATLTGSYTGNTSNTPEFTTPSIALAPNSPLLYKNNGQLNWEPDPRTGYATWSNPLASLSNISSVKTSVINSTANIGYSFLPSLQFKTVVGFSKLQTEGYTPITIASQDPATNNFATGTSVFVNNSSNSYSIEPQLTYKTNINVGRLDVLVGGSLQSQSTTGQRLAGYGYKSDALLKSLAYAEGTYGDNLNSEYKYTGVFGRLTYNWLDKYILNINVRRDGSSRFGPGNQFGNFGSVGTAWVFSNETFFQRLVPFVSFGKARFSYGVTGNDNIGDYKYLELYISPGNITDASNWVYQGLRTIESQGATNKDFHWESTKKMEFALDLGLFKDRILVSGAYFQNRSSDQLGDFRLPNTAGQFSLYINQPATLQNSGLEFTVTTTNLKSEKFKWTSSLNWSMTRNKLLKLPEGFTGLAPIYGYDSNGIVSPVGRAFMGIVPVYQLAGVDSATGLYQFLTLDGAITTDPNRANPYAKTVSLNPEYYGGLSNTFSFNGFSLDIFLQFSKQLGRNYLYDSAFLYPGAVQGGGSINGNVPVEIFDQRWQKPGDLASFQRFSQDFSLNNSQRYAAMSDAAWVDASFVRLKNVSFSYNIPSKWLQRFRITNLRLYAQGQNLWTITNYKGTDPETQNVGVLAPLKVFTAGIQITL